MFTTRRNQLIALSIAAASVCTLGVAAAAAGGQGSTTTAESQASTAVAADADTTVPPGSAPVAADPIDGTTDATHDAAEPEPVDVPEGAEPSVPPSSAPATPAEPADELDEDDDGQSPGIVEGEELPVDPPEPPAPFGPAELVAVPQPVPPLPPVPAPLDLTTAPTHPSPTIDDLVAPIDTTPLDGPTDFQVAPLPAHLDTLSSGLTGCELDCVQTALLTANDVNPNVHLAVETAVPVHIEVEVAETGGAWSKWFANPGYDTSWDTVLGPLQPDTTYDLTLTVIDQDGHDRTYEHQFTTVDIVDGFTSNTKGCALPCITEGVAHPTDRYDIVQLHVETDTPASLAVWVSTDEPTWNDGVPSLPSSDKIWGADVHGSDWTLEVDGLAAQTTYHVVVRAADQYGADHRVGAFTTDPVPMTDVLVTFEKIDVLYDGDSGTLNRGELAFRWGFDGGRIGWRSEEKMHFGVVELDSHNSAWFSIDSIHGSLPEIRVAGAERDGRQKNNICEIHEVSIPEDPYEECTRTKTNVARSHADLTVAAIEAMPLCAGFGIDTEYPGARCAAFTTPDAGDDYARFAAIVSFSM